MTSSSPGNRKYFIDSAGVGYALPFHSQEQSIGFSQLSQMKDDCVTNSHCLLISFSFTGWQNVLFELGSERVSTKSE